MKNRILYLLAICICGCMSMFGQTATITTKFKESAENPEIAGILKALDASQVTATLYADSLYATYYEIWMVECCGREKCVFPPAHRV